MSGNGWEVAARRRKAERLVLAIDRLVWGQGRDPFDARVLVRIIRTLEDKPDTAWANLAARNGINPPSAATTELVVEMYRERLAQALASKRQAVAS